MRKSVSPPGSDRLFGCNEKSLSRNRQPPANHQALLLTDLPPVRGRYPHRPELFHTSLLSPHAQPLHHPSACFWGTAGSDTFYFVYSTTLHLFNLFTFLLYIFRFSVRGTPSTCISCLRSKIPQWEHWSPTLHPQSSMPFVLYRYFPSFFLAWCFFPPVASINHQIIKMYLF